MSHLQASLATLLTTKKRRLKLSRSSCDMRTLAIPQFVRPRRRRGQRAKQEHVSGSFLVDKKQVEAATKAKVPADDRRALPFGFGSCTAMIKVF